MKTNENPYLSIGKVSKLKNVSIKALRYYDKIGILKPAYINQETNYRYYTKEQLYLLDAITLCIHLGIPLKDLHHYVENDAINLQKLLYDGKILAEEKILEIHKSLEALQDTLQALALTGNSNGMAKLTQQEVPLSADAEISDSLPNGFFSCQIPERLILTVPLEELDTPKYYGQYILKLFVTAQQMGLSVSYPSGVLHEYQSSELMRYMFLTLDINDAGTAAKARSFTTVSSDKQHTSSESAKIRPLPAGNYLCRSIASHVEGYAQEQMQEVLQSDSFCIIETDTLSARKKEEGYPFELQYCR